MNLSILAGMMIAVGAVVYLKIGGLAGALMFAIGLMTILWLQFELFTGKAGLLASHDITFTKLYYIWWGNFFGTAFVAIILYFTPLGRELAELAQTIVETRIGNGFMTNFAYGIMCGVLMYIAVNTGWLNHPAYAMVPVASFIMCGFTHCVADMFYLHIGCQNLSDYWILIPTTIGNIIGTNLLPFLRRNPIG